MNLDSLMMQSGSLFNERLVGPIRKVFQEFIQPRFDVLGSYHEVHFLLPRLPGPAPNIAEHLLVKSEGPREVKGGYPSAESAPQILDGRLQDVLGFKFVQFPPKGDPLDLQTGNVVDGSLARNGWSEKH